MRNAPDRWFGSVLRDVPGKDTPPDRYVAPERVREARKLSDEAERLVCASRFEEAIPVYDRALLLNPGYMAAWGRKGAVLGQLARYEDSIIWP